MIVVTRSRQVKGGFLLLIHCRLITNELMHCLVSVVWATTFFPRHPGTPAPGLRRKGLRSQELPAAREKARPKRGGRGKALKGCDTPLPGHGPYGRRRGAAMSEDGRRANGKLVDVFFSPLVHARVRRRLARKARPSTLKARSMHPRVWDQRKSAAGAAMHGF